MSLVIHELEPHPALRGVVRRASDFHERTAEPVSRIEGPMIGVVLIVSLGPDIDVGGQRTGSFVAGLWDRPVITGHSGEQRGYQLNLDLAGARRLLGVPAAELSNRLVALDDLVGRRADELTERLAGAAGVAERHVIAQSTLVRWSADGSGVAPEVTYALDRIRATHGASQIEALAAEIGWSRRHLSGRFREEIGLPPKAVARLARVEHAAERLRSGDALADVAFEAGYADQPHFTREFRDLVGCTPGEFPFVQDAPVAA